MLGLFVCLTVGFLSCGTAKRSAKRHPRREKVAEKGKTDKKYLEWQKQRVDELKPLLPGYFGKEALFASSDTTLSAYIPAEKFFRPNSSTPFSLSAETIEGVVQLLREQPDLRLCIAGHESNDSNEAYNVLLSGKRANNLLLLLEDKWNSIYGNRGDEVQKRLSSTGYGSRDLVRFADFHYRALMEFRFEVRRF